METLIRLVEGLDEWAYLAIFIGSTLESAAFLGLIVPGETLAILGGFLAASGVLDLFRLTAAVAVGAIIGDSIGYELGRRLGRPWLLSYGRHVGLPPEALARVARFFERHGGKAVLLGRFVGIARALAPFVAGSSRMPYATFLAYNAAGAIVWAIPVAMIGYLLGGSWRVAEHWIGRVDAVAGAIAVLVLVALWWRRRDTAAAG